jgi:TRAP-type C4-dicarboxylate transport system substrate-binding protein
LINKNSYDALPPDIKYIIEGLKWEMPAICYRNQSSEKVREHYRDKFRKSGMEITTFPPEERAKLVAKASVLWDAWKEQKHNNVAGSYEFFDAWMKAKDEVVKLYPDGIYDDNQPLSEDVKRILELLDK